MAEPHDERRAALSQSLSSGQESDRLAPLQSMGSSHRHRQNLGTALVESQWIEDQVQLWLSKMTRRISEAEASQKIVTCVQTLSVITERAIKSEIIEEK